MLEDRVPLARMMVGGASQGGWAYRMGPEGLGLRGALCVLPLRAFFCSFSVSDDFFLISCLARLYSVQGQEGSYSKGSLWKGSGNPAKPRLTFRVVLVQLVG